MPDYSKAKLYALRSHMTDDIYIGSSCTRLTHRLHIHRCHYRAYLDGKREGYITSFEILKYPDHYIELLRAVPCTTKEELHKLEGDEIRATACVNKFIPGRTKQQYYEEHKEHLDQYRKQWHEDNKESVAEYQVAYHQKNIVKAKADRKEHYQKNKEAAKERAKKNYQDKKDIRECPCGASYNHGDNTRTKKHIASKRHQKYLTTL